MQRGGKIRTKTLTYPLSEDPSLADLECAIIAERMRECWRRWNHNHPFVEVVDHRRVGDNYEITVPDSMQLSSHYKEMEGFRELLLGRFIQELYFLHRKGRVPGGRFNCVLQNNGLGGMKIALMPAIPKFRSKPTSIHKRFTKSSSGCELSDIKGIVGLAIKRLRINASTSDMGDTIAGAAEWLGRTLSPVPIPITYSHRELVSDEGWICASMTEKMGAWPACCYDGDDDTSSLELQAPPQRGRPMMILRSNQSYRPDLDSPRIRVEFRSKPHPWEEDEMRVWETIIGYWRECLNEWSGRGHLDGKAGVRMRATLEAEKFQLLRGCYAVELIPRHESGAKKEEHGYRLLVNEKHPLFGEIKRADGNSILDKCIENATFEVCINKSPDPLYYEGVRFRLEGTKIDDPNVLILSDPKGGQKPPERGWMRVYDIGTRTLQKRKQDIISRAVQTKTIRDGFWNRSISNIGGQDSGGHALRGWEERHPNWRVSSYGNLQLVQGPPGTGKTWTATRIVEDILRERPNAKILLCAKEHLALDHLANSVKSALAEREFGGFEISRVVSGRRSERGLVDGELDPSVLGKKFTEEKIAASESISNNGEYSNRLSLIRESMVQEGHTAGWPSEFLKREASVVCVTTSDGAMLDLLRDSRGESFDYAIVEEAGKSYPSELIGAVAISRNTILIGDQMQLPPFEIKDIRRNLLRIFSVDYGRLRKDRRDYRELERLLRDVGSIYQHWNHKNEENERGVEEVVGDIKPWLEPFRWLFELFGELNSAYIRAKREYFSEVEMPGIGYIGRLSSRLEEQRRMFENLSDVVGEVFYGKPFVWMKEEGDCYVDSELPNPHREKGRLILVDSPHCSVNGRWREKRSKTGSFCNQNEADIVAKTASQMASGGHQVVVLSPYQGQVDLIRKKLGKNSIVKVNTVDGFQGKEADFILLSLVRNNEKTAGGRWGFVNDPNRLNVALSRAREGLIVFTSLKHVSDTEFKQGDDYLGRAIEMIGEKGRVLTVNELGVG